MEGILNQSQIDYVLYHLHHHVRLTEEVTSRFHYFQDISKADGLSNQIVFLMSEKDIGVDQIKEINNLPVLFPHSESDTFWYVDTSGNLIFCQDILKSIFYLLSGYQEFANPGSNDSLNRFSFNDSLQCKLRVTGKPLVNYYFNHLVDGLMKFCSGNSILLAKRALFKNFGFLLTHDIDVVDYYTYNYLGYKVKEIIGLKQSKLSRATNLSLFFKGMLKYLNILKRDNPYWNFQYLREVEKLNNLRSVFFFLDKDVPNSDADYAYTEKRLIDLFAYLKSENCEIGLHGTVRSINDVDQMQKSLIRLKQACQYSIHGIRQHRLLWKHPKTACVQEQVGLRYDSTLGFAAHEGFRNSYCHPFKLYNFEEDKIIDVWEFPLNVMDVTLFAYQHYSKEEALQKCEEIIVEIQKFGGVFTLLWHNSFFDEVTYPGVTRFYETLLEKISFKGAENILGIELMDRIGKFNYE
jgi:hypothetical protein